MAFKVIIKQENKSHKVLNTNANNFIIKTGKDDSNFKINSINGQGPAGLSAYAVALNEGFVGSREEWIDTLKGSSAYEVALDNGFVGSEQEWLDSLKSTGAVVSAEPQDANKILTNDGERSIWMSIENKLNSEDIVWDLGNAI